jgi:hypothetical protein
MPAKKSRRQNSLDILVNKAEKCATLAKAERGAADRQHENAHKLEVLGKALEREAAVIDDELEGDAAASGKARSPASK